jgi:nucleoside-diphosphate-sugar epimerase
VAGHCIGDLLARGYDVRGTVRDLETADLAHLRPAIGEARLAVDMLGVKHEVTTEKAVRELGWTPRPLRQSVLDTAESLICAGAVRPRS